MIRILKGIIYGIAAGITAAVVLDYLDGSRRAEEATPAYILGRDPTKNPASTRVKQAVQTGDDLTDEARQALLDELGAQLQ